MPTSFGISLEAYCKLIFHAHKYPANQVYGILIGSLDKSKQAVVISDSLPLFHGNVLAPMLEAALMQIEEYCNQHKLSIVGTYFANELLENNNLSNVAIKLGEKIHEQFSSACILLINNKKLSESPDEVAVQTYVSDGKQWRQASELIQLNDSTTFDVLSSFIEDDLYLKLNDFDSHLEDISKDWFNTSLFE